MQTPPFIGGQLFNEKQLWLKLIEQTKNLGGHVHSLAKESVELGKININHNSIFQHSRRDYTFPHRYTKDIVFRDKAHCRSVFAAMSEQQRNYANIKQKPGKSQALMNKLLKELCLEIVPESDRHLVTLNPANLLEKTPEKSQLLIHYIHNPLYTKPKVVLDDIKTSANCLLSLNKISKTDLKSAYKKMKKY